MKFILKNPDETNEKKPYIIRFCEPLKTPLADLTEFDPMILQPIPISNYQKELFTTKARTFWICTYLPISVIRWNLENLEGLAHYAYCTHDRDIVPQTGELKKVHTHLLLYFEQRISSAVLCSYFHTCEVSVYSQYDVADKWNYLIHDSKKCRKEKKFLYPESERFTDDKNYWLTRCVSKSENDYYVNMYKDFSRGMPIPDFIHKYGYEAIRSVRSLKLLNELDRDRSVDKFKQSAELTNDFDEVF